MSNIKTYATALRRFDSALSVLRAENQAIKRNLGDNQAAAQKLEELPDGYRLSRLHAVVLWAFRRIDGVLARRDRRTATDSSAPTKQRLPNRRRRQSRQR